MNATEEIVFDSGRFPYWIRIPALLIGVLCIWFAVAVVARTYWGNNFGFPFKDVRGSSLLGVIIAGIIAFAFFWVAFAQLRIIVNPGQKEMKVLTRQIAFWHVRRFSLSDSKEIAVRNVHNGIASTTNRVEIVFADGRRILVTDLAEDCKSFVTRLSNVTNLPIHQS